jgi:hypothetical protein
VCALLLMNSPTFKLDAKDFLRRLIVAVISPVAVELLNLINMPGFTFAALDRSILIKIAVGAFLGYIMKNFLSDKDGKFLGGF